MQATGRSRDGLSTTPARTPVAAGRFQSPGSPAAGVLVGRVRQLIPRPRLGLRPPPSFLAGRLLVSVGLPSGLYSRDTAVEGRHRDGPGSSRIRLRRGSRSVETNDQVLNSFFASPLGLVLHSTLTQKYRLSRSRRPVRVRSRPSVLVHPVLAHRPGAPAPRSTAAIPCS